MSKLRYSILIILISLVCLVIQGAVFKSIFYTYSAPNLLLVIAVFLAFFAPERVGLYLCFVIGLLYDLSSDILLGLQSAAFVCLYVLLNSLSQRIFLGSFLAIVPVVFFSSLFTNIIYLFLVNGVSPLDFADLGVSLPEAFVTALFAPFLFRFLNWIPGKNVASS